MFMPRNDAAAWSKKVQRIIKSSLKKEEEAEKPDPEKARDYHEKVLEKISKGRKDNKN
jgi:hypothetical protein